MGSGGKTEDTVPRAKATGDSSVDGDFRWQEDRDKDEIHVHDDKQNLVFVWKNRASFYNAWKRAEAGLALLRNHETLAIIGETTANNGRKAGALVLQKNWICSVFLNRSMKHWGGVQINENLKNRELLVRLNANSAAQLGIKFEDTIVHELTHVFDPKTIKNLKSVDISNGRNEEYYLSPLEFDARMAEMYSALRRQLINTIQSGANGNEWIRQKKQNATNTPFANIIKDLNVIDPVGLEIYLKNQNIVRQMTIKYIRSLDVLSRELPLLKRQFPNKT